MPLITETYLCISLYINVSSLHYNIHKADKIHENNDWDPMYIFSRLLKKKKKEHTTPLMQKPATSLYHTIEAPASTSASAALHFHKAIAFQTTEDTKCIY